MRRPFTFRDPAFLAAATGGSGGEGNPVTIADLIAFWKLDEASGTRADSWASFDLTPSGTLVQVAGHIDHAARFTPGKLSVAHAAALSPTSFSVYLWFNPASLDADFTLAGKFDAANAPLWRMRYEFASDTFLLDLGLTTGIYSLEASDGQPNEDKIGAWTLFHFRWDNDTKTILTGLNENITGSTLPAAIAATDASLTLGSEPDDSDPFDGALDEVAYYGRSLTTEEHWLMWKGGAGITLLAATAITFDPDGGDFPSDDGDADCDVDGGAGTTIEGEVQRDASDWTTESTFEGASVKTVTLPCLGTAVPAHQARLKARAKQAGFLTSAYVHSNTFTWIME